MVGLEWVGMCCERGVLDTPGGNNFGSLSTGGENQHQEHHTRDTLHTVGISRTLLLLHILAPLHPPDSKGGFPHSTRHSTTTVNNGVLITKHNFVEDEFELKVRQHKCISQYALPEQVWYCI